MESLAGAVIDQKYRLIRLLGEGGMGAVYEALDLRSGHVVALKLLNGKLEDPAARARFEREARALSELSHESILRVLDYGCQGSETWFAMELAPGVNLMTLTQREGPLAPERAARIALTVLGGLTVAHARGLIHRDVKPQNIQVAPEGPTDTVRLLDFGLAKDVAFGGNPLTQEGMVVGTLQYMAPEQARGVDVDARADVYAVGACLYTTLTGRRPFEGAAGLALYRAVLADAPMRLLELRPSLPPMLVAIIERAMAKRPEDRFASALEMARALSSYLMTTLAAAASQRASHRGHTIPLAAMPAMPASHAPVTLSDAPSSAATLVYSRAAITPPDTPVPDTTPSEPPPDACPPTQRSSGKGTMLAGIFVLVGLGLVAGVSALALHAGAPSRIYAALPR